jgi:hypothetical protein
MEQAKKTFTGDRGVFEKVNGEWKVRTAIRSKIDPFTDLCIRQGVTRVKEWSTSPEEYRAAMYRLFSQGMNRTSRLRQKCDVRKPSGNYPARPRRSKMLTDGIRGSHDYDYNWLSFTGKDLEVIVDLEEMKTVHRIESAYYQYGFWLRLFPKKSEYYVSADGNNFEQVGS